MDLLDFEQAELYFDEPISEEVEHLIDMAAANYGNEEAELMLLRANFMAPQHLMVLVALYRYYFYQHRLEDALLVAESTLAVVGRRLEFPETWALSVRSQRRCGCDALDGAGALLPHGAQGGRIHPPAPGQCRDRPSHAGKTGGTG